MSFPQDISYEPWPPLSYPDFAATQHLLHMGLQAVGKLKLREPFEPQWAEVPLWLSSQGFPLLLSRRSLNRRCLRLQQCGRRHCGRLLFLL